VATRLSSPILRNFLILALVLLVVLGGIGLLRGVWLEKIDARAAARAKEIALTVGKEMASGKPLTDRLYQRLIDEEPRIGYLVVANYRNGYRSGAVNAKELQAGGQEVAAFLAMRGDAETLARLIVKDGGFPGEYLDVYSVALLPPSKQSDRTPLGSLKIAYLIPGFPYGRGYYHLWTLAGAIACLATAVLLGAWAVDRRKTASRMQVIRIPIGELEDLESAVDEDTTSIIDEWGREWKPLFDGRSLDGWVAKGEWYVTEREIAGQPWGGSLIYPDVTLGGAYALQIWAKKIAGPDGFVVLFVCDGKLLTWVLGGWDNSRSEVAGYPETGADLCVERFLWYKVEVRVGPEVLEGSVEDTVVWRLKRSDVTQSSPELGFQKGLGLGVWSTLAKFKELRFLSM
jgi:hypothetical protein